MHNHTTAMIATVGFAALLQAAPPAESPFAPSPLGASGQIRLRSEANHKSLADSSRTSGYGLLRSRLGWTAEPGPWIVARIEMQDTRILGSEPQAGKNTPSASTGNAKGVDISQAWGLLRLPAWGSDTLRVAFGRMGLSLGSGRFLSTLEWSPNGRRFDGIAAEAGIAGGDLVAFAFQVRDTTNYAAPVANGRHNALAGLWGRLPSFGNGALSLEAGVFQDVNRIDSFAIPEAAEKISASDLTTWDLRLSGKLGLVTYEQEVLLQTGESWSIPKNGNVDHLAWSSATRVGVAHPIGKLNLGFDAMSGDGEPQDGTITQYRASYWFAHQYYGWMDYFVNNPRYGVLDARIDAELPLSTWGTLKAQGHWFLPQVRTDGGRSLDPYGKEIDAELHVTAIPRTLLVLGAGVFLPDDGAPTLGNSAGLGATTADAPGWFLYVSPSVNF